MRRIFILFELGVMKCALALNDYYILLDPRKYASPLHVFLGKAAFRCCATL